MDVLVVDVLVVDWLVLVDVLIVLWAWTGIASAMPNRTIAAAKATTRERLPPNK